MLFSAWAKSEPCPGLMWSVLGSLNPRHCYGGNLVVEFHEAVLLVWGYDAVGDGEGYVLRSALLKGLVDGGAARRRSAGGVG